MFDNQNARNKPSSKNSSSAKQFQLQRGIQLQVLEVERESFAKISQDEKPFLEKSNLIMNKIAHRSKINFVAVVYLF